LEALLTEENKMSEEERQPFINRMKERKESLKKKQAAKMEDKTVDKEEGKKEESEGKPS